MRSVDCGRRNGDTFRSKMWKDMTTLLECYQQPDTETLRQVVEYETQPQVTHTVTHTPVANRRARHAVNRCRA